MEETVIWEQHTVTLHRVSVYNSLNHSSLSSLLSFSLSACLWHPNPAVCLVCSSLFPHCSSQSFAHPPLFSLCTERASCSSRMCGTETIVKEPRWQETRLRKTEISIHFLTASFHFLPVGNILFLTQLQEKRGMIVLLHVLFVLYKVACNYD